MVQFLLRSCSIVTVLKRALSRKQNTRRNCKEKNSRSGKSNFFTGFRDVADFFTGNRDLIHPWWAPVNAKATKYTHCFAIFNSFALITLMHINMRKEIQSDKANKVVLLCFGPQGESVIGHISERENENWMEKLRDCVNDQSGIQRDWVNLR